MQTKLIAALSGTALAAAGLTALLLRPAPAADVETGAAVAQEQPAQGAPGAIKQGIAVKGHWNIEVRNPDGSVAQRREFENALMETGTPALARIFSRQSKVAGFALELGGSPAPCAFESTGAQAPCYVVQLHRGRAPLAENSQYSHNLTATETSTGIRLTGSKIASHTGVISMVFNYLSECYWERTEAECLETGYSPVGSAVTFTAHGLSSGINVVEGQQVLVTVDLSFVPAP